MPFGCPLSANVPLLPYARSPVAIRVCPLKDVRLLRFWSNREQYLYIESVRKLLGLNLNRMISGIDLWWARQYFSVRTFLQKGVAIALVLLLTVPTNVPSNLIAYDIDLEMDKAREEKTVEHYGEGIRDIVKDATDNNVNAPDSKETAENSYERESKLNDVLPKRIGQDFSQEDLADMEN